MLVGFRVRVLRIWTQKAESKNDGSHVADRN